MELPEIETHLLNAIDSFSGQLLREQLDDMRELACAGEPGVAFENLCTQVFEYDLRVSPAIASLLEQLGVAMGISRDYWERLDKET